MSFEPILPPDMTHATNAPVKASVRMRRGAPLLWLWITAEAQQTLFGRALNGVGLKIAIGAGEDRGQLQLTVAAAGRHMPFPSLKGAVRIPVGTFEALPSRAVKARPCEILRASPDNGLAIIRLPKLI